MSNANIKPVEVFEIAVQFTHIAVNSPYNNAEVAIRWESGLKPRFVIRRERFSFVIDDVELNTHDTDAAGFVIELRAARLAVKNGKNETRVLVRRGKLYSEAETVVLKSFKGNHDKAEACVSEAVSFLIDFLTTGNETALLVMSDYLTEKLGERMAIATGGVLADVVSAAKQLEAQRAEYERRKEANARLTYAQRARTAARRNRGLYAPQGRYGR